MQNKVDEKDLLQEGVRLQRKQIRLMIIFGIISALPFLLQRIKVFAEFLNKLSLQSKLPILTIQLIIVLILFVILTLYLSLHRIIKKNKIINMSVIKETNINPVINKTDIDTKFTIPEEFKDIINKQRDVFFNLQWDIKNSKDDYNTHISKIVKDNFPLTDKAIAIISDKLNNESKKNLKETYYKYNNPAKGFVDPSIEDIAINIYNMCESELIKVFGENFEFKTGKDLLLHNLQVILDLLKYH